MKKLIAILTIAIVLVGAVFATPSTKAQEANGNAYIDILATILEDAPRFELAVKSGATAVANANPANDGIDAVDASDTTIDYSELSAADAAKLADGTGTATVVFSINQIASARTNANYELTVTAGDLELIEYSNGTAKSGALADNEVFSVKTKTLAVGSAGASIKGAVLTEVEMASVSVSGLVLTVDYHGVVAAAANNKKELGTFTVEWEKNEDAVSGKYQAAITLNVTAK